MDVPAAGPAGTVAAMEGSHRRAWRLVLAGTLVSATGAGLTLPFLLVYLHQVRHISLPVAGAVLATSGLIGLAASTTGGSLADRVGLGRVVVVGLACSAAGRAALAAVHGPLAAAGAVALVGVGDATTWPALNGLVADLVPEAGRHRAYAVRFGVLNAGIGLGGLIAGAVVSLRHPGTFEALYLADGASSLAFAAVAAWALRGLGRPAAPPPDEGGEAAGPGGYRAVLGDRTFRWWLATAALFTTFGYAQLDGAWAEWATGVAHASPHVVGFAFAANTGVIVVAQLGVAARTTAWRRSRLLAVTGAGWAVSWGISAAAALPALRGAAADGLLIGALGLFGLAETCFSPVHGGMPNQLAPLGLRGRYNALTTTVWNGAQLLGPPLAGVLLGSAAPGAWAAVVVAGCVAAGGAGLRLGRRLPAEVERPPAPVPAAAAAGSGRP